MWHARADGRGQWGEGLYGETQMADRCDAWWAGDQWGGARDGAGRWWEDTHAGDGRSMAHRELISTGMLREKLGGESAGTHHPSTAITRGPHCEAALPAV